MDNCNDTNIKELKKTKQKASALTMTAKDKTTLVVAKLFTFTKQVTMSNWMPLIKNSQLRSDYL